MWCSSLSTMNSRRSSVKRQTVWLVEVLDHRDQISVGTVKTVDVTRADLGGGFMTLVIVVDAVGRVGEPDRSIRMLNDVIGAVQPVFAGLGGLGSGWLRGIAAGHRRRAPGEFQCGERLQEQRIAEAAVAGKAGRTTRLVPEALVIGDIPE
jgi:hypothetical protein